MWRIMTKYGERLDGGFGEDYHREMKSSVIMFAKFVAFSCGAGVIQFGTFTLLNEVSGLNYWASYSIALVLSVIYNFTINRRYTFKSVNNIPIAMALAFAFYLLFAPYTIWLTDYMTDGALFGKGLGVNEYAVIVICMVQNLILEFVWWRFVIFRKSINSRCNDCTKTESRKKLKSCKIKEPQP